MLTHSTGWTSFPFIIDLVTHAVADLIDFAQVVGNNSGEGYIHDCTDNPGKGFVLLEEALREFL